MMRGSLKEILKELGWDTGFRIPIANDENKQLETEVVEKADKKDKLVEKLESTEKRIESIEQHIANIKVEHSYNQKLLTAYVVQYEAEDHLHRISENEDSAIVQQIRSFGKEKKDIQERVSSMKTEFRKLEDKLNLAKDVVAMDKTTFLQWQECLNREEEDQQLIQKYMKLDRKKLKKLDLKRRKLTMELESHRQFIIKIMGEICEREIILDSTSKFYIQILEERRQLIDRWTQSTLVLRQRDGSIQKLLREIETLKEISVEKMKLLTESTQFMDGQCKFNRQLENSIKKIEKKLALVKEERLKITENTDIDNIEFKTRKKALNDFSQKTQSLRAEMKNIIIMNRNHQEKINDWKKQILELKVTLDKIKNHSVNIDERTKQLESMIESEEKRKQTITRDTKRFQDLITRISTRISHFQSDQKMVELQKKGVLKKIELATVAQVKAEKLLIEKKDMVYQLDLQIHQFDIQLGRNEGIDNKAEVEQKQQMIEGLQDVLNDKKEITKLLQRQISNLEYEVKKVQSTLNSENHELEKLRNKKQNLGLMIEGGEKGLKIAVCLNEERQVAENILELRVTQAEEMMRNTGDRVYNLERCRLQIYAAMKERMAEIKLLQEAQSSKNKLAFNECSELRGVLSEKHCQIQHLKMRYDKIIAASATNPVDGGDIPLSTTYLRIQNAQEKFELQERGDKLDAKIRRTEQEIKSMENTLRVVNACNDKYKVSLGTVEDDSSREELKQQLDEELCSTLEQLRKKRLQLDEHEKAFLTTQNNYEALLKDVKRTRDEKGEKHRDIALLKRQIIEQKGRIMRADSRLRKLYNDIQQLCQCGNYETIHLQEKDITTHELEEINLLGLQRLTEFTIRHVEAEIYVKKLMTEKNIVLPCAQHIKLSSSPSLQDNNSSRSSIISFNHHHRYKKELVVKQSSTRMRNTQPIFVLETIDIGESSLTNKNTSPGSQTCTGRKKNCLKKNIETK